MNSLFEIWTFIFSSITTRYFLIAGIAFLFFYIFFPNKFKHLRIQNKFPKMDDYKREVFFSFISMIIFSIIALLINFVFKPYTQIYNDIHAYGIPYLFISFILMLFIHDTYFYWTHRLMHHKKLYNIFHLTHHKSRNPSPWAAYSFHPLEAVVEAGVLVVIAFIMPVHQVMFVFFFLFSIIINVIGHLGYEIFPKKLIQSKFGRYVNTSVAHNLHHKYNRGNFGFYFSFWDRIMGTLDPKTDKIYDEIKERKSNNKESWVVE